MTEQDTPVQEPPGNEVGDAPPAASPPRPPRPSYAALAAAATAAAISATPSTQLEMRDPPPPRPPKPAALSPQPVASSTFFEGPSAAPPSSSASRPPGTSTDRSFRPAGSYSQAVAASKVQPSTQTDDQVPPDADEPSSDIDDDDDELRIAGNEGYSAPPAVCPTTGRKAIRMYGKGKRSSVSRPSVPPPSAPPLAEWDDNEWGEGSAAPSTRLAASTSAARYEGAGQAAATWEELVQSGYAEQHPHDRQTSSRHFPRSRRTTPTPIAPGSVPRLEVGGWTTPRVLAKAGQYGSKPGVWAHTAYDFEIADTPAGAPATGKLLYKAMGTECHESAASASAAAPAESSSDAAMKIDQMTDVTISSEASADDPIQDPDLPTPTSTQRIPFRTVTRAELDAIRPHSALYFCPYTFAWCLFAKTEDGEPIPEGEPMLWQAADAGAQEEEIAAWCVSEGINPPLPDPIPPADPTKTSLEYYPLDELEPNGLHKIVSNRNRVCVLSTQDWYPAVIAAPEFTALLDNRAKNPNAGQSAADAQFQAVRTIWRALDNVLFVGMRRGLPVNGRVFTRDLGWDKYAKNILVDTIGATIQDKDGVDTLCFKQVDNVTEEGQRNRTRMLRCWLELSIWLEHFKRSHPMKSDEAPTNTRVTIKDARGKMATAMGQADLKRVPPGQAWDAPGVPRLHLPNLDVELHPLANEYGDLGVTPNLADEVIIKVYDMKCLSENWLIPFRLHALIQIADSRASEPLRIKVAQERSIGRHPAHEITNAFRELHLPDSFDPSTPYATEDELVGALQKRLEEVEHAGRRTVLLQSAKTVADYTGSEFFKAVLESAGGQNDGQPTKPTMDLDAACRALGIEKETDDELVLLTYEIRLTDAESESDKVKIKDALRVLAEARKSQTLHRVLQTGTHNTDAGWEATVAADPRIPVGLTNIANTCYLNSLLQYFFTIREMRETILAFVENPQTDADGEAQIRVGGRLVSQAEIKRSKRFVILLKTLFEQLIHAPVSAVTPETELAYLALVPSREEVEAAAAPASAPSLTAEPDTIKSDSPTASRSSPAASSDTVKSPSSVLGKRKNGDEGDDDAMQVDLLSPMAAKPTRPLGERDLNRSLDASAESASELPNAVSEEAPADGSDYPRIKRGRSTEGDQTNMQVDEAASPAPPPLPPRPTAAPPDKEKELERQVSSYMAFGRQNDVTECMDNVMFQVEAALLANSRNGHAEETANLLRKTFFGTLRQQIAFDNPAEVDDPVRTQDEPFSSLLLDVPATSATTTPGLTRDIYDALDTLFEPSQVELESHAARRHIRLIAPPPTVLQVQLQRVQYDRERQSVYKSNAHLAFEDELDVGRYLENQTEDADEQARRARTDEAREELKKVRSRLSELTQDKTSTASTLVRSALSHVKHLASSVLPSLVSEPAQDQKEDEEDESMEADASTASRAVALRQLLIDELFEDTEQEAKDLEDEIESLTRRVVELKREMRQLWEEGGLERKSRYKLTAVFIHRGTALSGHYYIYQRDPREEKRWLKYNDSLVTEVDADEIFRETTGDTNAYFLSYVRMDRLDAVEAIKREPA
ncbi:hypothetical protein JCM10908_004128 [Rhodotorula pacifica]|uniref:ubiquitin-specific protease UBP2 n=1 Tax=Rhodotorula pacifica TaxID=1495444 RepID=UPI00316BAA04